MRRAVQIVALLVLAGVAIWLPMRAEWRYYRQTVPAPHTTTVPYGRSAVFEDIRWQLVRFGPAVFKKGDLPADGLVPATRPGETLVVATLRADALTKDADDLNVEYSLRDPAGHEWTAYSWHTTILYGYHDPAYVMGRVPGWAVNAVDLVMRREHPDLSPALGGPQLVFRR